MFAMAFWFPFLNFAGFFSLLLYNLIRKCSPNIFGESAFWSRVKLRFPLGSQHIIGSGAYLGGGCRGCAPPPPSEMTCGFLIQLVFCKKKTMWFIGVEVEQETSAPPPKKNPGSAPEVTCCCNTSR